MSKEIIGVIPPIITPIDENEKVDEAGLRKLINHCIDHGIHGIFICGSCRDLGHLHAKIPWKTINSV